MPRKFGTNTLNPPSPIADTAFYAVDVDHKDTIIAAGMTMDPKLIASSVGVKLQITTDWVDGTSYTPILVFYPNKAASTAQYFHYWFGENRSFIDVAALVHDPTATTFL